MQEERVAKTSPIRFGRENEGRLSNLSKANPVVAVCCSDIHLSLKPPLARSCEKNWLACQSRQLGELRTLSEKHSCPIIVAGDIFDKWENPAELVNFALAYLPKCFAIPGQHDLAHHSYEDIHRTSYWTLVEAGIIDHIGPEAFGIEKVVNGTHPIRLWGFPWKFGVSPCPDPRDMILEIGIGHFYCWKSEYGGFPGAPEEGRVKNLWKKLKGYDVLITGDNHIAHETQGKSCFIYNCGTFFRRKMTERDSWPSIGLIHADGSVERHLMDVSQDKFIGLDTTQIEAVDGLDDLVRELEEKNIDSAIDFRENLNRVMESKGVSRKIRSIVMGALEDK